MEGGGTVNVDGYDIALPFYQEVSAVALLNTPSGFRGRCLIVNVDGRAGNVPPELAQLQERFERATLTSATEEPFWKEIPRYYGQALNLFEVTLDWLKAESTPDAKR
jgi:hypothetical protein